MKSIDNIALELFVRKINNKFTDKEFIYKELETIFNKFVNDKWSKDDAIILLTGIFNDISGCLKKDITINCIAHQFINKWIDGKKQTIEHEKKPIVDRFVLLSTNETIREYMERRYKGIGDKVIDGVINIPPYKCLPKKIEIDEAKILRLHLIEAGYISDKTDENMFLCRFGCLNNLNSVHPIIWIKKNSRTGTPNKKSLLDLLVLMGYNEMQIKQNINDIFFIDKGKQFKAQDYTGYKNWNKDIISEYHKELEEIVIKSIKKE